MTTHTLFALDSMDSGTGRKVEIDGIKILLVRIDDDIYAISDTCSHADVSLSNGFVEAASCDEGLSKASVEASDHKIVEIVSERVKVHLIGPENVRIGECQHKRLRV